MTDAAVGGFGPVEKATKVPRHGLTRNPTQPDGRVPVAVLSIDRLHGQADWTVLVSVAGQESAVAVPRHLTRDEAVEVAWRDICIAAAQLGREG